MASRLSRADAGERVAALADALSDALLMDELNAKEAMEALFAGGLGVVSGQLDRPKQIVAAARRMVEATQAPYANLCSLAARKALESIGEELDLCEATLAKKYAGISDEAVVAARGFADAMVLLSTEAYLEASLTVLPWFEDRLLSELHTAKSYEEDDDGLARLIAPAPLAVANHSGRGLWWKVLEHCNRMTREAEIATVNAVREHAMEQFNAAGELR